jgi:hypothetical protein
MLFIDKDNKLMEINRYDFKNDKIYYTKILNILDNNNKFNINNNSKKKTINKINNLLKYRIN